VQRLLLEFTAAHLILLLPLLAGLHRGYNFHPGIKGRRLRLDLLTCRLLQRARLQHVRRLEHQQFGESSRNLNNYLAKRFARAIDIIADNPLERIRVVDGAVRTVQVQSDSAVDGARTFCGS
jgi:hypothetical protein